MKKIKDMLNAKKETFKLGEGKKQDFSKRKFYSRTRKLKRWYFLYVTTTVTTVILVALLLLFGVGSNNRPLRDTLKFTNFADKVASWFSDLDFSGSDGNKAETDDGYTRHPMNGQDQNKEEQTDSGKEDTEVGKDFGGIYDFDYSDVPEGCTPIIPMDLSLSSYGAYYINNATGYSPDTKMLLDKALDSRQEVVRLSAQKSPVVLIIHTHATEAYSDDGAKYVEDINGFARTSDTQKSVVAVGETVSNVLNKKGIPTVHCKILHDNVQYKDSYARAEETVRKYLEEFPSIKLVIDIHRDSIVKSSGEIVRPVTEMNGKPLAQMMCVVGSDWKGEECPNWENNLSLALKLRESLENKCQNVCRPVFLKGNTYNQELAKYSLLVEIGSSGNSLEEAQRSAELLGISLSELILKI